jgi:hypothetical protein
VTPGWFRWGSIAAVLAAVVAIALPASASAGQPVVSLKVAKHRAGPYTPIQFGNIELNEAKSFYWKAKNITDARLPDVLLSDSTIYLPGWVSKWFKGKDNITADVQGGGYAFGLKAGKSKFFRSRLKPTKTASPLCAEATAAPPETSQDLALVVINDALCSL